MINILFISTTSQTGGGPAHLYSLIKELDKSKYRLFVAAPSNGEFFEKFSEYATVYECSIKGNYPHSLKLLSGIIKENDIQIIHSHGRGAGIYSRPLKLLFPKIKVAHTYHGIHYENKSPVMQKIILHCERLLKKYTDAAICVSKIEKDEAIELGFAYPDRAYLIYNGIDYKRFQIDINTEAYRKNIVLDIKDYVVGCVARLDQVKAHKDLMEAFSMLSGQYPDAKLALIGDGPEKSNILRQIERLGIGGKCVLLGTRDDIPQLLKCMDVFALCSYKEGLPYTPIEAMASGTPVVLTNVTGNNEIVQDGFNGLLCEAGNVDSIYQTILKMIHFDRKDELIQNAKETVKARFSLEQMVERIEKVYDELSE